MLMIDCSVFTGLTHQTKQVAKRRPISRRNPKHSVHNATICIYDYQIPQFMHEYVYHRFKLSPALWSYFDENKLIQQYNTGQKRGCSLYVFVDFVLLCWISWILIYIVWISWISIISNCSFSGFRTLVLDFVNFDF